MKAERECCNKRFSAVGLVRLISISRYDHGPGFKWTAQLCINSQRLVVFAAEETLQCKELANSHL